MHAVNMNIFTGWFVIHVYCINSYALGVSWVYHELCISLTREMSCFGTDGVQASAVWRPGDAQSLW